MSNHEHYLRRALDVCSILAAESDVAGIRDTARGACGPVAMLLRALEAQAAPFYVEPADEGAYVRDARKAIDGQGSLVAMFYDLTAAEQYATDQNARVARETPALKGKAAPRSRTAAEVDAPEGGGMRH